MIIVRTIEDIYGDCWCKLTEENFNAIKKLGFKTSLDTFNEYTSKDYYNKSDIFQLYLGTEQINWCPGVITIGEEIKFELDEDKSDIKVETKKETENSLEEYGFKTPNNEYSAEILKVYNINEQEEYIGVIIFKNHFLFEDCVIPMKWDYEGKSLMLGWEFHLEPIEYKQRLYTKLNTEGFLPKQKFKVSWTRDMSESLENTGWIVANNEEIEKFKN